MAKYAEGVEPLLALARAVESAQATLAQANTLEGAIKENEKRLGEVRSELEKADRALYAAEARATDLVQNATNQANDTLAKARADSNQMIRKAEETAAAAEAQSNIRVAELEHERVALEAEIKALRDGRDEIQSEVASLRRDLEDVRRTIKQVHAAL